MYSVYTLNSRYLESGIGDVGLSPIMNSHDGHSIIGAEPKVSGEVAHDSCKIYHYSLRRRIELDDKAKVVALDWRTESLPP